MKEERVLLGFCGDNLVLNLNKNAELDLVALAGM